jgi:multidrug efflux pump subunit AcrB
MSHLKKSLEELTSNLANEYPEIEFTVTRNQTELLDYSIDNLKSNILVGAILAVLVIFLFMSDLRSPVLVMITIPLSLVASLLLLYMLGISINIISLSGLILGLGMMVDNSIIVIDNITQYWQRGAALKEAVVEATREVVGPMLSSVLTTCSVFVPLIFLSGISGALFYDQAMAVTMSLFTSLFVAVLVIPVYYWLLYRKQEKGMRPNIVRSCQARR